MAVVHTGKKDPACSTNRATDKKVVDACSGYFKGIKASYAIFDGAEGSQVGDDLAMYSDRLEKVFEDNPSTLDSVKLMAPLQEFDWRPGCENPLMLRYECVYLTPCPLCLNRKQCWGSIQLATGVTEKSPNDCGGYKANEASDPGGILYSVDVVLHSKGGGHSRDTCFKSNKMLRRRTVHGFVRLPSLRGRIVLEDVEYRVSDSISERYAKLAGENLAPLSQLEFTDSAKSNVAWVTK